MKEVSLPNVALPSDTASFLACLATILEFPFEQLPLPGCDEDPATGGTISRWLGGFQLGLAPVANPASFSWPGPWIARVRPPGSDGRRSVIMYGVPSGVVWDPTGGAAFERDWIEDGFLVAAADIALALPSRPATSVATGSVEAIWIASAAGEPVRPVEAVRVIAGRGLEGDRYLDGNGTFSSGRPGTALTLIEAEVCDTFDPPLGPDEHRRNLLTRGIDLNGLVGREFMVGKVRCRGMRLCEPCKVVQSYASRPILRKLVHRGGLRADILEDGELKVGDDVRVIALEEDC